MTALSRDLPLTYRYIYEWRQLEWTCLDCDQTGLRSDSPYNMRDTQVIAMRHNCR